MSDAQAFLKDVGFAEPFFKALKTLGSPQIRNQATIGGSILWNHPSSDLWPLYISLVHIIKFNELTKFSKKSSKKKSKKFRKKYPLKNRKKIMPSFWFIVEILLKNSDM